MKKLILIAMVLGGAASATYAGVNVSVGIGLPIPPLPHLPVVVTHARVYTAPVVVAPPVWAPPVVTYYPAYPRVYNNYGYYHGSAGYRYDRHAYYGHNDWRYDHRYGHGYCR